MKINVKRIPVDGEELAGSEPPEILELESEDVLFPRPVEYALHAQLQGKSLLVTGKVATEATLRCSRCLKLFPQRLVAKEFVFMEESPKDDFVDLTPQMREDILLELPQRAICQPDCKGLCHACGKDLNEGACGCKVAREELRWQALDRLKLK